MSVSDFIKQQNAKKLIEKHFIDDHKKRKLTILAQPHTNNYTWVGTAFDYLFRFFLEYHNKELIQYDKTVNWVSEQGYEHMVQNKDYFEIKDIKTAKKYLIFAKKQHLIFLKNGKITDNIIESALKLAQLDVVVRRGELPENFGDINQHDVEDLQNLIEKIDIDKFKAKYRIKLNPNFSRSELIGGADADLIIDDCLIDIKTSKSSAFKKVYFEQLVTYAILHWLDIDDKCRTMTSKSQINEFQRSEGIYKIGIYFSRFAYIEMLGLKEITKEKKFNENGFDYFILKNFEREIQKYSNLLEKDKKARELAENILVKDFWDAMERKGIKY